MTIDKFAKLTIYEFLRCPNIDKKDFMNILKRDLLEKKMDYQSVETKSKMAQVLKDLIKSKPFSKITVGEIVDACNMNRNTFYYHFENMISLLFWTYQLEVQEIIDSFTEAKATLPDAIKFILDYIDSNRSLCVCAIESLGEQQLQNIYEKDLRLFISALIDFYQSQNNLSVSENFKTFLVFNYTTMLSTQIVWYIKYADLDKNNFLTYLNTLLSVSIESVLKDGNIKKL